MTGSGSPCGACKFLRRKCVRGCIFAPYFSYEQGAAHFSAIHRVFGASNISKILNHLPETKRSEAALTISYEAQARLQDPIYGCVSHIYSLQQQVVNLQVQLSSLKQQAITQESLMNGDYTSNPSERLYGNIASSSSTSSSSYPQDLQSWIQSEYPNPVMPQFGLNTVANSLQFGADHQNGLINNNNSFFETACGSQDEEVSPSMAPSLDPHGNNYYQWANHDSADDLHSVAFGYSQNS